LKRLWLSVIIVIIIIILGIISYLIISKPSPPASISTPISTPITSLVTGTSTLTTVSPTVSYKIVIATGGVGGVFFYYGSTIAGIISNTTGISATAIQTTASIDNLALIRDKTDISKGVIYCATVMSDMAYLAYLGLHERFANNTAPIAILWAMYPNYMHIVTTADSGIKSVYDLKGRRVSTENPGSVTEYLALKILKLAGIDPEKDIVRERLSVQLSTQSLAEGSIDAFFWSGGLPTGSVLELAKTLSLKGKQIYLLSIDPKIIEGLKKEIPIIVNAVIPKNVYGAPEDANTFATWNVFVCHKDTPTDIAYQITKAVFENLDTLHKAVAAAKDTNLDNALIYYGKLPIPYHEGALKYFREKGVVKS